MPIAGQIKIRDQTTLWKLRYRWFVAAFIAILMVGLGYFLVQDWWPSPFPERWLLLSSLAIVYILMMLWNNLSLNYRSGETQLLSTFGVGNSLTLFRGFLIALLFGFLFSPRPLGWKAWVPGILYTFAALPDYLDGYFARTRNHVTNLGELLDMNVDSMGVFTATFLSVQYGAVPWWYLPIGLARYIFLLGIWLREKMRKPIYPLSFSVRRRGFAALKMGFIFVMLYPLFGPPGTYIAAAAFGLPFAIAFFWDWLLVSGVVKPFSRDPFISMKRILLQWLPLILRLLALQLILPQIVNHLQDEYLIFLGVTESIVTMLLFFGVAGRFNSIIAACLMGVNQNLAPLTAIQYALIVIYVAMIFLGTGSYSIWPVEDLLIYRRAGETRKVQNATS